jgi:hypothetical protein
LSQKQNIPGPGTYENQIQINKYGVYKLSTVKNSKAANWSPSKQRFFDELKYKKEIPGPGNYNLTDFNGS